MWLDESGVWDRMSAGHGKCQAHTNGVDILGTKCARGVGTCAPSALYLALDGNCETFEATVGMAGKGGPSTLAFRVYREDELVFESVRITKDSQAIPIAVPLAGAKWAKFEVYGYVKPYSGYAVWGDAKFTMKPGTRPRDIAVLTRQLGIHTPPAAKAPRINAPAVYGARPGNPFLFRVPVTGTRPMEIEVDGLPDGLAFDPKTQLITGCAAKRGTYEVEIEAKNGFGKAERKLRIVLGDRIALTPPLGWNSWNAFAWTVTGDIVRRTADRMLELGLLDHGYAYLTIDDGWQLPVGTFKTREERRDANGEVRSNELFGDMKALADYVHARGVKIGLYSSPGPTTCADYEGSWMHEFQDARTYAKWGYDYLKHDWCSYTGVQYGEGLDAEMFPYVVMGQALRECGRDIVHSICQYGKANVAAWGEAAGGQCWRTTGDKFDFWEDVRTAMLTHEDLWRYPRPGAWNDADMMLVGKTFWSDHRGTRLTPNEQYTHVSMWGMWASTMMIGCDLEEIDAFTLSLLTNDEVLEISQDELGKAAAPIDRDDDIRIWARPLADGSLAVALVNLAPLEHEGKFCFLKAGMEGAWRVRDVWRQADEGEFAKCYRAFVPGHATKLIRLWPTAGAGLRKGLQDIRDNFWFRKIENHRPLRGKSGPDATKSADCADCGDRTLASAVSPQTGSRAFSKPAWIPREKGFFRCQIHRGGGAASRPDNTLETFLWCWGHGVAPEADARLTKDGVAIAQHDGNFRRVGRGVVGELATNAIDTLTWEQVRKVDVGSYLSPEYATQRVPTLESVFAAMKGCPDRYLYVDEKGAPPELIAELAAKYGVTRRIYYTSSNWRLIPRWRALAPEGSSMVWLGTWPADNSAESIAANERFLDEKLGEMEAVAFNGIDQVQIHVRVDSSKPDPFCPSSAYLRRTVERLHRFGVIANVLPWTEGDRPETYRRLLDIGFDTLTTDYPDALFTVLDENRKSSRPTCGFRQNLR